MRKENVEDIYKLSHMQQGMLFHGLYAADEDIYFRQLSCSLRGELNLAAFEEAWRRVVARHAVLRTSFHWQNLEEPVQVVHRRVELPLDYRDWRGLGEGERRARLEEFLREEELAKFDFARPPLIRLALVRLAEDEHRLVFSNHHMLFDGWSRALLLKEVFTLYEGLCRGAAPELERPRPYRDYITWLRRQDRAAAEGFWRRYLKGFAAPTPFIPDRADAAAPGERDEQSVSLSKEATAALQGLAARHRLTLNTILQGAWALLLSRYSGEQDVVFGAVVSGRPPDLPGVQSIVGLFINTLPVRVRVPRGGRLLPWLEALQAEQAELREYEYSPLVEVQGWSEVARGKPLFESLLVVDNYPADASMRRRVAGFDVGDIRGVEKNNYPLALSVIPGEELLLRMPFDRGRLETETAARMLGHLRTLLEGMAAEPGRRISDLPMLTADELGRLRGEWSGRGQAGRGGAARCIHELFEARAAATPNARALSLGGERLTYGELNRRANQLAHHLRGLGVGPEAPVGVFLERSADSVVSLLGILKAGGVYLPLDPAYPSERVEYILLDAEPKVILTQDDLLPSLPVFAAASDILCLDSDWGNVACESEENPAAGVAAGNTAYVIYTSGSTGNPKGVCLPHGAAAGHFETARELFGIGPADRVLQFASLNFDVSLEQIMTTLCGGGELSMRGPELWSTREFRERLRDDSLTVVNPPTAYWHKLVQDLSGAPGEAAAGHLRLAIAGGEAMSPQAVRLWQRSPLGGVRLLNAYGPTEAVITSLVFEVPAAFGEADASKSVPIGRPLPGRAVYLLDADGNNVPVGVAGELYIGGEGLARGYLNRPGLTAEKFVPDPFSTEPGARLYRTGDLGRYLPDGQIEFLGRADDQVKVRGFRIELGEVEAALSSHESVGLSAVAVREDSRGEPHLVAYVVARDGETVAASDLRAFLGRRLPEYMVPSQFVALEELPLTPNGKVDRKRLPEPESAVAATDSPEPAQLTPAQELLANIWSEILDVTGVGPRDDFFALGGHSLLSTQLVSRVREVFNVELPLRTVFEKPTLHALAAEIEAAAQAGYGVQAPPVAPADRGGALPLSFAQRRLWFAEQMEPGTAAYNRPLAVRLNGRLDADALGRSLAEIVRRHEVLRTTFAETEGGPVQIISPEGAPELALTELSHIFLDSEREARAAQIVAEESVLPFDLSEGPLLRARLLRLGEEEHVLLLVAHHVVTDGWSEGVLLRELAELYGAYSEGRPSPLPELPVQYADYAAWQRGWLRGEALEGQLEYWKRQLSGAPELRLGADRPRPEVQTRRGGKRSVEVPEGVAAALRGISRRRGVTLFMTLLASYKALLYRYTGQDDIAVGTGIAGRNRAEIESLIGFFVNQLVLRTDFSGARTFGELLSKVRDVTLAAYAHQDLPFERLVEELQPGRDPGGRQPFFQTVFLLQNAGALALDLPGLVCSPFRVEKGTSHYDLTWSVSDLASGLRVVVEYNSDIFEGETVGRMLEDFAGLLEGVATDPDAHLLDLPLKGGPGEYPAEDDIEIQSEVEFAF